MPTQTTQSAQMAQIAQMTQTTQIQNVLTQTTQKTRNDTNNTHGTNQECADTNSIIITQGTYGTNNAKLTDNGLFSILQFRNSLRAFYVLAKDT